jgi:hypothetical protein
MNESKIPSNHSALSEALRDPVLIRLVTVLNITSQSILEILEYGFDSKDISRALAKGIVQFARPVSMNRPGQVVEIGLEMGAYYHELLRERIQLTAMGRLVLEILDSDLKQAETESDYVTPTEQSGSLTNSAFVPF